MPSTFSTEFSERFLDAAGILARYDIERPFFMSEMRFLCEAIFHRQPKVVVELGSRCGASLCFISHMLQPDATLISVDLPGKRWGWHCHGYTWTWTILTMLAEKLPVIPVLVQSAVRSSRTAEVLREHGPVDFVYHDADHRHLEIEKDLVFLDQYLAPDAAVAFHDIGPSRLAHRDVSVRLVWDRLKREMRTDELIQSPDKFGTGIAYFGTTPCEHSPSTPPSPAPDSPSSTASY